MEVGVELVKVRDQGDTMVDPTVRGARVEH